MILEHYMIDVGSQEVNVYLLADETSHHGVLIDAGGFDQRLVDVVIGRKLQLGHVLITHLHWDHTTKLPQYLGHWPKARVVAPAPLSAAPGARVVKGGDTIEAGPLRFHVLRTSGHTPESVSYYCPSAGVCFVGDALFAGAVGGTTSDAEHDEQIGNLRDHVLSLPDETELLPGHGPITTVRIEKTANPFLRPGFGR